MEKDLNKFFRNPPKGGNGRGVSTHNAMAPVPAGVSVPTTQGTVQNTAFTREASLRANFDAGKQGARTGSTAARADNRNHDRRTLGAVNDPTTGYNWYDHLSEQEMRAAGQPTAAQKPTPVLNPDTSCTEMTTGRACGSLMPRNPDVNPTPNYVNGARQDGTSRDNPAHILGRNCGPKKY